MPRPALFCHSQRFKLTYLSRRGHEQFACATMGQASRDVPDSSPQHDVLQQAVLRRSILARGSRAAARQDFVAIALLVLILALELDRHPDVRVQLVAVVQLGRAVCDAS